MKKLLALIAILAMFLSVNAQDPPHPNDEVNPTGAGSGNTPVGGGAPVGGGLLVLLGMGAAYGLKKWVSKY